MLFRSPENFNTYILARSLDVTKPKNIIDEIINVDSIYLYLGKEEPYIVFSEGDKHLKVYNLDIDTKGIRNQVNEIEKRKDYTYYYLMKETLNVDNNIYIPYKMNKAVPLVYVENELNVSNIEESRSIAEKFFDKEIDYIREIIENNGSI